MSVKRVEAPEEFDQELDELEKKIDRLRIQYEQYFLGIEKLPPYALQQEVVRIFHQFGTYHIRKTNHKFRYQALIQRFSVHRAYWQRTVRAIEEGTYQRHRWRLERRELARSGELVDNEELAKRSMLAEMKGDEAVEARRQRLLQEAAAELEAMGVTSDAPRPALLRGIERRIRRRRRRKKELEEIQGVPLEELRQRAATSTGQAAASDQADPMEATAPERSLSADPAGPGPLLPPGALPAARPKREGLFQFPPLRLGPPPEREVFPRIPFFGRPADLDGPSPASGGSAERILRRAGIGPDRAQQIYDQFVEARRRTGQPVEHVTYEKLAESMARQVVKAQQALGVDQVDFTVVSKDDRILLKPVPK